MTGERQVANSLASRYVLEDDTEELQRLFELAFGRPVSPTLWRWKYRPPWTDRAHSWVGLDDDRIMGHIGMVPMRGLLEGRETPFLQFTDIMVAPAHRSLAVYSAWRLDDLLRDLRENGPGKILYGFSGHRMSLFYRWIARATTATVSEAVPDRIVRPSSRLPGFDLLGSLALREWSWEAEEIDHVWRLRSPEIRLGLVRDRTYLGWRYANHPAFRYRLWGVHEHGEPVGWLVTRHRESSEEPKPAPNTVRVLDLLLPDRLRLAALQKAVRTLEAEALIVWLPASLWPEEGETQSTGWTVLHHAPTISMSKGDLEQARYYTLGEADEWWW